MEDKCNNIYDLAETLGNDIIEAIKEKTEMFYCKVFTIVLINDLIIAGLYYAIK